MWDFCYPRYQFEEALDGLRRHFCPEMLDRAEDPVLAKVEFDMRASKKDKYLEEFSKMVPIINQLDPNVAEKSVLAFVPNEEEKEKAMKAGATQAGGEELIQDIIKGRIELVRSLNYS